MAVQPLVEVLSTVLELAVAALAVAAKHGIRSHIATVASTVVLVAAANFVVTEVATVALQSIGTSRSPWHHAAYVVGNSSHLVPLHRTGTHQRLLYPCFTNDQVIQVAFKMLLTNIVGSSFHQ